MFVWYIQFGETPLHSAAGKGQVEVVKLLLSVKGVNLDLQTDVSQIIHYDNCCMFMHYKHTHLVVETHDRKGGRRCT